MLSAKEEKIAKKIDEIYHQVVNNFRYKEGIGEIEKLLKQHKLTPDENILCRLGLLYDHAAFRKGPQKRKRFEEKALSLYRQALSLNRKSHRASWGIGRVWLHRKSKKAIPYALKAYRLRKKNEGSSGLYPQHLGLIYTELGNYRRAEYWYLRGRDENPGDFGSYLNLVGFYRFIRKFNKAKEYAKILKKLYEKENINFRKTPWGRKINETIKNADKSLNRAKGSS